MILTALVAASVLPGTWIGAQEVDPSRGATVLSTEARFQVREVPLVQGAGGPLPGRAGASEEATGQLISFSGGQEVLLWTAEEDGGAVDRYRLSLRGDGTFSRVREAADLIHMRRGTFDPLLAPLPALEGWSASGDLHIVQFETQAIDAYRDAIGELGGEVLSFLPESAHIVRMPEAVATRVRALPFVRWVGDYTMADRVEAPLLEAARAGKYEAARLHVQVFERGPEMKARVADRVRAVGGQVVWMIDEGFRFDAVLDSAQLAAVAAMDEVVWIDRWTPFEEDMGRVRVDGGADYVEGIAGYTGAGVRGEVMDGNVDVTHPDLQSNPVILHGNNAGSETHGTPCTGIVFGDGTSLAVRRGLLPDGQPIFGDYGQVNNRYVHTQELLSPPYEAVFQSNSWGSGRTTEYTSTSMQMDDILFDQDIVLLQSQSNAGDQMSRPQAWAKNILSVGGIRHQNTQTLTDDAWNGGASVGPAADGRIKPDLCHWYDNIDTIQAGGGGTDFGGTSAATPIVAGHFGLFFQMWHDGIFGNSTGATVFDSAPKATLSRAIMINTADAYDFSGPGDDLRRTHQGWGRPDLETLYDARNEMFFVNEDVVLEETDVAIFPIEVEPGTPRLAVTMVYLDRPGTTSASVHRINDLSLEVIAPNGSTSYWGNQGLLQGNESTSGGASNTRDVVENVLVSNPTAGTWTVRVIADDLNQDTHVETPGIDADFALVVRGTSTTSGGGGVCQDPSLLCAGSPNTASVAGAQISWTGSSSVAANDLILVGSGFPPSTFGLVARSMVTGFGLVGDGVICIDNPIIRMEIIQAGTLGGVVYPVDASAAAIGGAVMAGETWHYQIWYRDGQSSNFSDAISVPWCE